MAVTCNGIWDPNIIIQYQSLLKASSESGIPKDKTATNMKLKLIMMFVDVPKPLSTRLDGTVSSIAFGVVQMSTPHEKPKMNLPKHIM